MPDSVIGCIKIHENQNRLTSSFIVLLISLIKLAVCRFIVYDHGFGLPDRIYVLSLNGKFKYGMQNMFHVKALMYTILEGWLNMLTTT